MRDEFMKRIHFLFIVLLLLLAGPAQSVGTAFTYQGQLSVSGTPADGPYDFEFRLFDAVTGGAPIGSLVLSADDLEVRGGVFTVELDFGLSPFDGSDLWLDLRVRDGLSSGILTELSPRQQLTAVPYAIHSEFVAAGAVGQGEINPAQVQRRVLGGCTDNQAIAGIAQDGTMSCINNSGDIASVTAGTGLMGGGLTGDLTIAADTDFLQRRVSSACNVGDAIRAIQADGSVICEPIGPHPEPAGVASTALFSQTRLDSTVQNLGSQTITAPSDGVIVAIGKGTFNLSHSFSVPGPRVLFSVSLNLGFHNVSPTQVAANDDFNNLDFAATAIAAFTVTAGDHEIYLMGSETTGNGNANAKDLSLVLMYFPTAYGPNPF